MSQGGPFVLESSEAHRARERLFLDVDLEVPHDSPRHIEALATFSAAVAEPSVLVISNLETWRFCSFCDLQPLQTALLQQGQGGPPLVPLTKMKNPRLDRERHLSPL